MALWIKDSTVEGNKRPAAGLYAGGETVGSKIDYGTSEEFEDWKQTAQVGESFYITDDYNKFQNDNKIYFMNIIKNSDFKVSVNNSSASSITTKATGFKIIGTNDNYNNYFELYENNGIKVKHTGYYNISFSVSGYLSSKHFIQFVIKRVGTTTNDVIGTSYDTNETFVLSGNTISHLNEGDVLYLYCGGGYGTFTYHLNYNAKDLPTQICCSLVSLD